MEDILIINNLNKSFGNLKAVNDLSFKVKKGEFFSFLGVNGAGKSTTISILCGILKKDSGNVFVLGKDIDKNSESIKNSIGVVFQNSHLDDCLTVYDNLKSRASLYNIYGDEFKKRIDYLSDKLDFKNLFKRQVSKLSGGQKRRIDIARALIHSPSILILDEPTTGLDPQTRKLLWSFIDDLRKNENLTVFLTTHYMEEAAESDYVVILNKGSIAASGTPIDLKNRYSSDYITIYNTNVPDLGYPYEVFKDRVKIKVPNTNIATKLIIENKDIFKDYEVTKGKLDDVFLNVTGTNFLGE